MLTLVPFTAEHFDALASWFSGERELLQWTAAGVTFPLTEPQIWPWRRKARAIALPGCAGRR